MDVKIKFNYSVIKNITSLETSIIKRLKIVLLSLKKLSKQNNNK